MKMPLKKITISILFFFIVKLLCAQGGLVSFYKIGSFTQPISEVATQIKTALTESGFKMLGEYKPANDTNMYVLAFTRQDLLTITMSSKNRGALASAMRVGLVADGKGNVDASLLNPQYLFYGYLGDFTTKYEIELNQINIDIISAVSGVGDGLLPYITSSLTDRQLKEYRFMLNNPGFNDQVVLKDFGSFDEGVRKIEANLKARKGRTFKVYSVIDNKKQIAVFGVGLWDEKKGEPDFLNQLGSTHLAAMPYEIILTGKQASILHGKFRFPFFWSDLSMNQYSKIYRTPREVQEVMGGLTN